MMEPSAGVILANRAYLDHHAPRAAGERDAPGSAGGLLAALAPVIAAWDGHRGTTWIGAGRGRFDREWTDPEGYELIDTPRGELRHRRLFFSVETWERHYARVSNAFLWPALHLVRVPLPRLTTYYPSPVSPSPEAWEAFRAVNRAFAEAALAEQTTETCWVHDYQLALAPALLRAAGYEGRCGFFLHTPFPNLSVVEPLLDTDGRALLAEFVAGILGADVVGFQTEADVLRFTDAAERLCGAQPASSVLRFQGREVLVRAHPVGIDVDAVIDAARDAVLPAFARDLPGPLVVGIERFDFTKGIPERLRAIARLYRTGRRFSYAGVAAPTRSGVSGYDALRHETAAALDECQRAAAAAGAEVRFLEEALPVGEVLALQRDAAVVLTTSLADGMNLVPLQAVAAQSVRPPSERGVLVAGADAGVANLLSGFQRDGFVAVDPLDASRLASAIDAALAGRPGRVSDTLVAAVRGNDARRWASAFLADLEAVTC